MYVQYQLPHQPFLGKKYQTDFNIYFVCLTVPGSFSSYYSFLLVDVLLIRHSRYKLVLAKVLKQNTLEVCRGGGVLWGSPHVSLSDCLVLLTTWGHRLSGAGVCLFWWVFPLLSLYFL